MGHHKIKWKRKNNSGQTMSQCGRFWFVTLNAWDAEVDGSEAGEVRLWHDDTNTLVGHFASASDAKWAAQYYMDNIRDEAIRERNERLVADQDEPVDEFAVAGARIVGTRALTQTEVDNEIWPATTVALELENGVILYASRDGEGNGPGALFGQYKDGGCFQLGVTNAPECSADTPAEFGPHERGKWDYRNK